MNVAKSIMLCLTSDTAWVNAPMSPNGTTPVVTASASTIGLRKDVAPGPATSTNIGTGTAIESKVKCMPDWSLTSAILDHVAC